MADSTLSQEDILRTALREHAHTHGRPTDMTALPELLASLTGESSRSAPFLVATSAEGTLVRFRAMLQDTSYAPEIFLPATAGEPDDADEGAGEIDYSKLKERSVCWAVGVPGESSWATEVLDSGSAESKEGSPSASAPHRDTRHKFPFAQAGRSGGSRESTGAFLKFYDDAALSPTTVHTVMGLLTHSPAPPSPMSSVETSDDSTNAQALYPTIHVLSSFAHTHPLDGPDNVDSDDGLPSLSTAEWKEARAELVTLLAQIGLEGEDEWVGEWVLAALCQKNAPPLTPLSVALLAPSPTGSNAAAPPALPLLYVLEQLVPTLHPLDLSIPLLNAGSFAPRARDKEEDLEAGAWQIPKGGVGYVRESAMGDGGKLNERGIDNLQTLAKLVQHQTLAYQYPFSAFAFAQDLVFLIEGDAKGGTLLPVDVKIKLQAKGDPSERKTREQVAAALPPKATLDRFRAVVARAKAGSLTVPLDVSERIQTHFVDHRSTHGPASITAEDLGVRMRFCRALALSEGASELSWATWERGWEIEEKRRERGDGLLKESAEICGASQAGEQPPAEKLVGR